MLKFCYSAGTEMSLSSVSVSANLQHPYVLRVPTRCVLPFGKRGIANVLHMPGTLTVSNEKMKLSENISSGHSLGLKFGFSWIGS